MTNTQNLHVATGIIGKYAPAAAVTAEHDAIFVHGPPPDDMSVADVAELRALGWTFDPSLPAWTVTT